MAKKTHEELEQHLVDILERMTTANARFDAGRDAYAPQLATEIRTLVHHAGRSQALLEQLGYRTRWGWVDEAGYIDPVSAMPNMGPVGLQTTIPANSGPPTVRYVPHLGSMPDGRGRMTQRFQNWWERKIVRDSLGEEFSRMDLVKAVANQDGGAHVDPRLPARFDALKNGGALGNRAWMGADGSSWMEFSLASTGGAPGKNDPDLVRASPVPALIRQFSHELLETVRLRAPSIFGRIGQ